MKIKIIKEMCGDIPIDSPEMHHGEGKMARGQLYNIVRYATELMQMFDDNENLPEWVEAKITKAFTYLDDAAHYLEADNAREQGLFDINALRSMMLEEFRTVLGEEELDEKKANKICTKIGKTGLLWKE